MLDLLCFLQPDLYENMIYEAEGTNTQKIKAAKAYKVWKKQINLIVDSWEQYLACLNRNDNNEPGVKLRKVISKAELDKPITLPRQIPEEIRRIYVQNRMDGRVKYNWINILQMKGY